MTARRVTFLLIASVVVIALAAWLSSNRHAQSGTTAGELAAGQPVLPGLEKSSLNSVTEVRLSKGDGTRTTLRKGAADWTVGEREYLADSGKVRKLLLDLAALNVVEGKTRIAENYPALGVEDIDSAKATGTRVDAVTPAKTVSLIVGKSSGAKSGFVRVVNSPQSLLAAPLITLDADPRRWLDHTLIDIAQDRIKQVAVKPADGPGYTASRTSKEQPDFTVAEIPKGRELSSPAAADPIAGSLGAVSLDDVQHAPPSPATGPSTGSPAGVAHAVFNTFDGLKIDVAGRKDGTRTLVSFTPRDQRSRHGSRGEDPHGAAQRLGVRNPELQVRRDVPAARGSAEEAARARCEGQRRERFQGRQGGQETGSRRAAGCSFTGAPTELSVLFVGRTFRSRRAQFRGVVYRARASSNNVTVANKRGWQPCEQHRVEIEHDGAALDQALQQKKRDAGHETHQHAGSRPCRAQRAQHERNRQQHREKDGHGPREARREGEQIVPCAQ